MEIAIVAIVCGLAYAAFEEWNKTRRAELASGGGGANAERIAELEARVETLEKIVTDRGFQLEEEFRRLERSA